MKPMSTQSKKRMGRPRRQSRGFQAVIKIYRDDPGNKDKLWEVYSHLQGLIEKIKNIQQDRLEER